jgi:hypothetical protein
MVQSIIDIDENEDRILNIVKAKYGLKNKSQAVSMIAKIYEESFLEPELRPEYVEKLMKIQKEGKFIGPFSSIEELDKHIKSNA